MKARIICSTLAILTAGSLSAIAQEGDKGPRKDRGERPIPPEVLEKFDTNKDGKLDADERKAAGEARKAQMEKRRAAMLEKYDANKDGKLDDTEREQMRADMEAKRKEILEKYDADNDGKLSADERKAAIDAGEQIPPRPMAGRGGEGRGKGGPGAGGEGRGKGGPGAGGEGRGKGGPGKPKGGQ